MLRPVTQGPLHPCYLALVSRTMTSTSVLPAPVLLLLLTPSLPTTISTHSLCQLPRQSLTTRHPQGPLEQGLDCRLTCSLPKASPTVPGTHHVLNAHFNKHAETTRWRGSAKTIRTTGKRRRKGAGRVNQRKRQSPAGTGTGHAIRTRSSQRGRRQRTSMHSCRTLTARDLRT